MGYSGGLSFLWPLLAWKNGVQRALNEMRERIESFQKIFLEARRKQINRKTDVFGRHKFRFG